MYFSDIGFPAYQDVQEIKEQQKPEERELLYLNKVVQPLHF